MKYSPPYLVDMRHWGSSLLLLLVPLLFLSKPYTYTLSVTLTLSLHFWPVSSVSSRGACSECLSRGPRSGGELLQCHEFETPPQRRTSPWPLSISAPQQRILRIQLFPPHNNPRRPVRYYPDNSRRVPNALKVIWACDIQSGSHVMSCTNYVPVYSDV